MAGGRKRGGQLGNLNALKHGFYSKQFQKGEILDPPGELLFVLDATGAGNTPGT